jgi:CRISP-associated protein Cas1
MTRPRDLHILPKTSEGWSHLYIEHCRVDQEDNGVALHDQRGMVRVPCAMLSVLMIGPGCSVTSAAIRTLADHGCSVLWTGEEGVRFYAAGTGETRSSRRLLHQARCYADPRIRQEVAVRMYRWRFVEAPPADVTIAQLRGMEGVRVKHAYAEASREWGVEWKGRDYGRSQWRDANPINRALSVASSCLYGVCHAALVAAGYSTGLGFIHTGRILAFVYDIADLYRTSVAVPTAFAAVAASPADLDTYVRRVCREAFHVERLLGRIVADVGEVLSLSGSTEAEEQDDLDAPGGLWDPGRGDVQGGINHG